VGLHPIFLSPATDEFRIIGSFPHLESVTDCGTVLKSGFAALPRVFVSAPEIENFQNQFPDWSGN
jgi:hypothetical protein